MCYSLDGSSEPKQFQESCFMLIVQYSQFLKCSQCNQNCFVQALGALTVQQAVSSSFIQPSSPPNTRPSKFQTKLKNVPICYDYVQGKCNRRNCRYSHDMERIIMHNSSEKGICFDHLRGECKRGAMCRFSHNLKEVAQQSVVCQISLYTNHCYDTNGRQS